MKLVTFKQAGEERLGFLRGDDVVDPLRLSGDPADVRQRDGVHQGRRQGAQGRAGHGRQSAQVRH